MRSDTYLISQRSSKIRNRAIRRSADLLRLVALSTPILFGALPCSAQSYTIARLHSFDKTNNGGHYPTAPVIFDGSGNLFGTTSSGGDDITSTYHGSGVVYELIANGAGSYTYRKLHSFSTTNTGGANPNGGLTIDGAGNLFGTTARHGTTHGATDPGAGTVFEMKPNGSGAYTYTVLFSFSMFNTDGATPTGTLLLDSNGNIFGATSSGGDDVTTGYGGSGVIFELIANKATGKYSYHKLHSFGIANTGGLDPIAGLTMDSSGNLFGTTAEGGVDITGDYLGSGVVYELQANGAGGYTYLKLHSFSLANTGGATPFGGILIDGQGNLFGTTSAGGDDVGAYSNPDYDGSGVIFELVANGGGSYSYKKLHSFSLANTGGANPECTLIMDGSGDLIGTTNAGGDDISTYFMGSGVVFELEAISSSTYTYTKLHSFSVYANNAGINPVAGVTMDGLGNLFGTTNIGGPAYSGVVYELVLN